MTNISLLFSKRDFFCLFFSVCQDSAGVAINCQDNLNLSLSKYSWSVIFQTQCCEFVKEITEEDFNTHLLICVN